MENNMKIVNFVKYCKSCKYKELEENEEPCNSCLSVGARSYSERPIKWRDRKEERRS